MSLVGTRPPTVDEWEQYELHHRSRMSIKPGITGMWQASGRSDITDFEEVVKLDTEYIENWTIGLDGNTLHSLRSSTDLQIARWLITKASCIVFRSICIPLIRCGEL